MLLHFRALVFISITSTFLAALLVYNFDTLHERFNRYSDAVSSSSHPHVAPSQISSTPGEASPSSFDIDFKVPPPVESSPTESSPAESSLSSTPPHPEHTSPPELAIATFLSGQSSDDDDRYFNLTRLLTYQLVHAPATRIKNPNITFAVLCGKKLSEEKKNHLRRVGAKVITLDDVKLPEWYHIGEERYSEVFNKLRVFEMTQFKRVLFVDADILIMKPLDEIFEDPSITSLTPTLFQRSDEIHEDEGTLPKEWLFAARPENGWLGGFDHTVPPLPANYLNTGFFLIAPDKNMYDHLMNVIQFEGRFGTQFPEQDMLNYVFKREGPMPWRELDWRWCANFVNEKDYQFGIHSLHGKFWNEGPQEVRDHFQSEMEDMFDYEESLSL